MNPIIVAAIISSSVALVNVLVVVYFTRAQKRKMKREIAHMDFEERMQFPLSEKFKPQGSSQTPNTFDLEYKTERKTLLDLWNRAIAERALDKNSKEIYFNKMSEGYQMKADSLWDGLARSNRYRGAFFYVLAAEASVLGGNYVSAGKYYHYAAMIFRTLEEWDRSGGYYYLSSRCHQLVNTELELKKARRSLTRAMASYYAGLNYEGYEIAKAEYQKVIDNLKSELSWTYTPEELDHFEELMELRTTKKN